MHALTHRRTRRAAIAASLLGAVLATAGCGSGGGSEAAGGSSTADVGWTELVSAGKLTFCADISAPPLTFYDAAQKPVGAEIDLGDALAKSMGLQAEWKNTAFNGIIPALQAKQCDAILSQLYIKPEREEVVDFVPYMYAGNTLVVPEGDPKGFNGLENACGKLVATQTGTTMADFLAKASADCQAAGKPPVDVRLFGKDTEAYQQLATGLVDAYGTTVETAAYALSQQKGKFQMSGEPFGKITTGIATDKGSTGLHDGLTKALADVRADGTYDEVLAKWDLQADALPADGADASASPSDSASATS